MSFKRKIFTSLLVQASLLLFGCGAIDENSQLNEDDNKTEISVLDFNTFLLNGTGSNGHVEERLLIIPEKVAALNADVVILQEVWELEHRDFIIGEMQKAGYPHAIFYENPQGRSGWDVYGNGLLILSKLKPAGEPVFEAWGNWTRLLERKSTKGIMRIDLEVAEGKIVSVFDAHTSTKLFKDDAYKESHIQKRLEQVEQITNFMAKASQETNGAPQVLAIDLNTHYKKWNPETKAFGDEAAAEYSQLLTAGKLNDSFHTANPSSDIFTVDKVNNAWCSAGFFGKEPSTFLDYIFVSKDVSVVTSDVVLTEDYTYTEDAEFTGPLSDHYGVLSKLKL